MDASTVRKLKSKDGQIFEVEEKYFGISKVIKGLANDYPEPESELPLIEVEAKELTKIIEYMKHYETEKPKEIPKPLPSSDLKPLISQFDYDFIMPLSLSECIDLVNAANYLDIPELVSLTCARLASEMINCSVEEAREKFGIKSDMTEEEMNEMDKYPLD